MSSGKDSGPTHRYTRPLGCSHLCSCPGPPGFPVEKEVSELVPSAGLDPQGQDVKFPPRISFWGGCGARHWSSLDRMKLLSEACGELGGFLGWHNVGPTCTQWVGQGNPDVLMHRWDSQSLSASLTTFSCPAHMLQEQTSLFF